jgi:hypothetical protein
MKQREHGTGSGAGVGPERPTLKRVRDGRAVSRVRHKVEISGEERQGEVGVHPRSPAGRAEGVRSGREVSDQLSGIGVATEHQHDAHALRLPRLAKRHRDRSEPDAHGHHRGWPAPHRWVSGEARQRVANDQGVIRPEPLRPEGGKLGDSHGEPGSS